jgi:hypothetical protein
MLQSDSIGEGRQAPEGIRSLQFVSEPADAGSWILAVRDLRQRGYRTITARLFDDAAADIASALSAEFGDAFKVSERSGHTPTEVPPRTSEPLEATLLIGGDAGKISAALLEYLDEPAITLVAPVTERFYKHLPIYLISIPKAGTHLLFRLAEALGYAAGGIAPDFPKGGHWYYLLHSNAHTTTREFFRDELQRAPFGNRAHPFMRSPALFNYRNPFDILVSEANYWNVDGNSPLSVLLGSLSFEQRIARLIDDPWLLGSLRDRVGEFAAWLDCMNIVPVSFEEIVGDAGGGSDAAFDALVWSLQLKLHAPGTSAEIRSKASGRASPTFREGRIDGWRQALPADAIGRIKALPQDFMEAFGYDASSTMPRHAEAFRRRPLKLMTSSHYSVPYLVQQDFLGHNIVSYQQQYYGVPLSAGAVDLRQLSAEELSQFATAGSLASVRTLIVTNEVKLQIEPTIRNLVRSGLDGFQGDYHASARAIDDPALSGEGATSGPPAYHGDERVGHFRPLGSFLKYNLFRRRDGIIAVPMRIGPVDPNTYDLKFSPGVITSHRLVTTCARILRARVASALSRLSRGSSM